MVDIRRDVCGILVGGSAAAGINGVISAVVIQCIECNIAPIGIRCGWKYIKRGLTSEQYHTILRAGDVTRVFNRGGSILQASKEQLNNKREIHDTIRALQHLRVKYLITIGGTETAFSAHKLAQTCAKMEMEMFVTHVPKTIFNDLPLPNNCYTFGFSTARELGVSIVTNLRQDARTSKRWYIIPVIGARTGHLSLGIGESAAVSLTLIPEMFSDRKPKGYFMYQYRHKNKKISPSQTNDVASDPIISNTDPSTEESQSIESDINRRASADDMIPLSKLALVSTIVGGSGNGTLTDSLTNTYTVPPSPTATVPLLPQMAFGSHKTLDSIIPQLPKEKCDDGIGLSELIDIIDSTMIKRLANGKNYGTVMITEGLVDLLNRSDLDKYFYGCVDSGHSMIGEVITQQLNERWNVRNVSDDIVIRSKSLGFELRTADPNAHDILLSRELGYAAVMSAHYKKINATIVTMRGGELESIPLSEMVNPDNPSEPTVKSVNLKSLGYSVALSYMDRLTRNDLNNSQLLKRMAQIACCDVQHFLFHFQYIAN